MEHLRLPQASCQKGDNGSPGPLFLLWGDLSLNPDSNDPLTEKEILANSTHM